MKKTIIIAFISCFMPLSLIADKWHDLADECWIKAEQLRKQSRYAEAVEMFKKAAEAERRSHNPRRDFLKAQLSRVGSMYYQLGRYKETLDYFKHALEIVKELGDKGEMAGILNNIGLLYYV